jgi:hypothetical protein
MEQQGVGCKIPPFKLIKMEKPLSIIGAIPSPSPRSEIEIEDTTIKTARIVKQQPLVSLQINPQTHSPHERASDFYCQWINSAV